VQLELRPGESARKLLRRVRGTAQCIRRNGSRHELDEMQYARHFVTGILLFGMGSGLIRRVQTSVSSRMVHPHQSPSLEGRPVPSEVEGREFEGSKREGESAMFVGDEPVL